MNYSHSGGPLAISDINLIIPSSSRPRLLDVVRAHRLKHCSIRTEKAYVGWIKRYILFRVTSGTPATWEERVGGLPQLLGDSAERKCCNPESGAFRAVVPIPAGIGIPCRGWTMSCGQRNRRGYRQSTRRAKLRRCTINSTIRKWACWSVAIRVSLRLMEQFACGSRMWSFRGARSWCVMEKGGRIG